VKTHAPQMPLDFRFAALMTNKDAFIVLYELARWRKPRTVVEMAEGFQCGVRDVLDALSPLLRFGFIEKRMDGYVATAAGRFAIAVAKRAVTAPQPGSGGER
jgi:hypothetical protein